MSTAEQLIFSLSEESRGIHVLLWEDKDVLVRVILTLRAALPRLSPEPLLLTGARDSLRTLHSVIASRVPPVDHFEDETEPETVSAGDPHLWVFFLQQAVGREVGPWLNGWRRPLSEPGGTLFVIRHADFDTFQRMAPDLASYVGPRIFDASGMLLICPKETVKQIETSLPDRYGEILRSLPGETPSPEEIGGWVSSIREAEG